MRHLRVRQRMAMLDGVAAMMGGVGPRFEVGLAPPDLGWLASSACPAGVVSATADRPGPHVALVALVHGNEIAGAVVLDRLWRRGVRPARGRLTLVFANLDAFGRFDAADPTASRFVDEDLNRLWDAEALGSGRRSTEMRRARALLPVFDTVDVLLDLHSMLWPSEPLLLAGRSDDARRLGLALGMPPLVIADDGHRGGRRLIDYARFAAADGGPGCGLLLEAGPHWDMATAAVMEAATLRLLRMTGTLEPADPVLVDCPVPAARPRLAEVTRTVTATTGAFTFLRPFRGGDVVARRNTLIAMDGTAEIRTPHDECLLVMPSLRTMPGHTAVRLARFVEP